MRPATWSSIRRSFAKSLVWVVGVLVLVITISALAGKVFSFDTGTRMFWALLVFLFLIVALWVGLTLKRELPHTEGGGRYFEESKVSMLLERKILFTSGPLYVLKGVKWHRIDWGQLSLV